VKRAARVAELMHKELAALLRGLSDPRLTGAMITRVELTDDLQSAKVYVRAGHGNDDPGARRALVRGFEAASRRLRGELTRALSLRYAPTLRFYFDEGLEAASRVDELLREIEQERKG
jgi:ribosome-binding factor A